MKKCIHCNGTGKIANISATPIAEIDCPFCRKECEKDVRNGFLILLFFLFLVALTTAILEYIFL